MTTLAEPSVELSSPSSAVCSPRVASWEAVLRRAIMTPGLIHEAYQRFHAYSLRN